MAIPKKKKYTTADFERYEEDGWILKERFSGATIQVESHIRLFDCTFNNCVILLDGDQGYHTILFDGSKFNNCVVKDKKGSKTDVIFRGCVLKGTVVRSNISFSDVGRRAYTEKTDFINCEIKGGYDYVNFEGVNLDGTKGFKFEDTSAKKHKGVTFEEKARMGKVASRDPKVLLTGQGLKKERNRVVSDLMNRVDKAKNNKELEDIAQEIGALQAQPEYVKEYKHLLDRLQTDIEKKYSSIYKGMRSLKKFLQRGRRASQIRTASKMLNELNKEISDLKEEL